MGFSACGCPPAFGGDVLRQPPDGELERFEECSTITGATAAMTVAARGVLWTVAELDKIVESSRWGYVNRVGYCDRNLYFNEKKYDQAKKYSCAGEKDRSSAFSILSLQKAAVACEYMENPNDAFELYRRLEREHADSPVADQIYYDLGRMYQKRKDVFKAREYFHKVITSYPNSVFSRRAKQRLFLMSFADKN
jgi:tetratricopeptide (TPR) repeat protein